MSIYRTLRKPRPIEPDEQTERRSARSQEFRGTLAALDEYIRNERRDSLVREHEMRERIAALCAQVLDRIRQLGALEVREQRSAQENQRLREALAQRSRRSGAGAGNSAAAPRPDEPKVEQ